MAAAIRGGPIAPDALTLAHRLLEGGRCMVMRETARMIVARLVERASPVGKCSVPKTREAVTHRITRTSSPTKGLR